MQGCPGDEYPDANGDCVSVGGPAPTPGTSPNAPGGPCPSPSQSRDASGVCQWRVPTEQEDADARMSQFDSNFDDDWTPFNFNFDPGDAPAFTARRFNAPTPESILDDPSYKFRLNQGLSGYQNSAAARGSLRTGATAKGLIDYAGNSASQEYGNAFDRALKVFGTDYQGDLDEYRPKLISYQQRSAAGLANQNSNAAQLWQRYLAEQQRRQFLIGQL